ncbi:hypothetical protein [Paenibacillus dendritiformis]|uniref:Lipoprotein n=1 Tax=Paenibacillus dendritiformis C454 TaxID=1131935 RepID=H3SNS8_9BACL|nr:hypothetical protein [Paenibacillus dendritiformis]EHQ59273.1 hypothetical protein PDENDC454_26143 [Paenibacillus dendritiformis C454]CAH8767840.1 hypothetical protein H7S4_000511 [Paenibacillus dendritiformis]
MRYFFCFVIMMSIIITGCTSEEKLPSSSGDWRISSVTLNGYLYRITEEMVMDIDHKIGTIEKYSDEESFLRSIEDTFSNTYPVGTNLYSIKGIPVMEAIAAEVKNNTYHKLICEGKVYGNGSGELK